MSESGFILTITITLKMYCPKSEYDQENHINTQQTDSVVQDVVMALLVLAKVIIYYTCGHNIIYYTPSKVYKVILPLTLGNISHLIYSVLAQTHNGDKIHIDPSIWIFGTASVSC